jgi:hypothetical protein
MTARFWRTSVLPLMLATVMGLPAFGQWTTMTLDTRYESFYDVLTSSVKNDVVSLSPDLFRDQVFGNPHVVYDDSGNWIITGYGDSQFGDVSKGDAVYVIKRNSGGGYERLTTPVLSWPPSAPGSNWTSVGAIDAGVGVAKTTSTTATSGMLGGYKYFMLVPIWQVPTNIRWVSWAVSRDGVSWSFVNQAGTGTTSDPASSLRLIYRPSGTVDYYHPAMVFNPANGYFYISLGFRASYGGIRATWWRIPFTTSNIFGLHKASGATRFTVERLDGTSYAYSDGTLPDDLQGWPALAPWPDRAADPKTTPGGMGFAADPLDIVYLTKADGTFDSFLFLYKSEGGFSSAEEAPIYYVRGTQPVGNGNIVFGTPQRLDLSSLRSGCNASDPYSTNPYLSSNPCYRQCSGAGRGYYLSVNQWGTDAFGKPQIFGFVTSWREDLYEDLATGCQEGPAGVLPVKFRLQ